MFLNSDQLQAQGAYSILVSSVVPRPIAWISSQSAQGLTNLAPYSFFTVASCQPPVLAVTQVPSRDRRFKDTLTNINATGECVVNIVSESCVEKMNASSANYPADVSEFSVLNVGVAQSALVAPPGVDMAQVRYECKLRQIITISPHSAGGIMMLLDVVGIYINDDIYCEGAVMAESLNAVGRMGGDDYVRTLDRFAVARPTLELSKDT